MNRKFTKHPVFATSTRVNTDVFKLDTGTSYYNNFLNEKDLAYMQKSKNRTGEIVCMTPTQYYEECANNIFQGTTVERLKQERRADSHDIQQYMNDMLNGDKFPLCYLNYADHGQEGLHRMMAAGEAFGWDTKFPVLVVSAVDDRQEKLNNIWRYWVDAVHDAEQYIYREDTWEEDFVEQVEYSLEQQTENHYDVVIVERRDIEECEKYNMDYAIEIVISEFQDIMTPKTVFEPKLKSSDEYSETQDDDWDIDDIDIDIEDLENTDLDLISWLSE